MRFKHCSRENTVYIRGGLRSVHPRRRSRNKSQNLIPNKHKHGADTFSHKVWLWLLFNATKIVQPVNTKTKASRKKSTEQRILEAACATFAEHGFRGTTVRMICSKAKANVAAISYYFGSKEKLYEAVYQYLFDDALLQELTQRPLDVKNGEDWKQELRYWTISVLRVITGNRPKERWRCKIYARERVDPSNTLPELYKRFFDPLEKRLDALLIMAWPEDGDEAGRHIFRICTISQCTIYAQRTPPWDEALFPENIDREEWLQRTADHVVNSVTCRLTYRG